MTQQYMGLVPCGNTPDLSKVTATHCPDTSVRLHQNTMGANYGEERVSTCKDMGVVVVYKRLAGDHCYTLISLSCAPVKAVVPSGCTATAETWSACDPTMGWGSVGADFAKGCSDCSDDIVPSPFVLPLPPAD